MMLNDVMSPDVLTTTPEESVTGAARAMTERGIGSACVVVDGELVGIVTERDVLRAAATGKDLQHEKVADWMTADPITIGVMEPPSQVANLMEEHRFRHLPVVDGGALVGIVSMRDVWRFSFLPAEPDDMTLR